MNEKILKDIKNHYILLTSDPEPEDEEKAQKELVDLFNTFIENAEENIHKEKANELLPIIQNWDTLEKWFVEIEGLSEKLAEFLSKQGMLDSSEKPSSESSSINNFVLEKDVLEEKQTKLKELEEIEARVKALEEKERLLKQKEIELKEKEKSISTIQQPKISKPTLKSKLKAPKLSVPKIKHVSKKITPSSLKSESENDDSISSSIKINLSASAQPIKTSQTPMKIKIPKSENSSENVNGLKIRPVQKPTSSNSNGGIKIKPISSSSSAPADNSPKIRPISSDSPKMKPVSGSSPSIKPISNNQGFKKVETPGPKIQTVNASKGPSIRPIGGISKPSIQPVGNIKKPSISPNMSKNTSNSEIPTPQNKPVNLFDTNAKKKPVNLFDQNADRTKSNGPVRVSEGGSANGSIQRVPDAKDIKKIGSLQKIDYAKDSPAPSSTNNSYYASLPPEVMYQEFLKFEAKRYYFDKNLKKLEIRYQKGGMDEGEYRGQRERNNFEIENCSSKIKEIRNMILGIN